MGKKGSCFSAVKKVLCTEKNKKKEKQNQNSGQWFRKKSADLDSSSAHTTTMDQRKSLQMRFVEAENEQNKLSYTGALATAVTVHELGQSKEEFAAIKIQTAFRRYLARREFGALKGLVRLKKMIEGQSVKRQTTSALRYMHTLAHVQSETRTRRIRMLEDNMALPRHFQQKNEKEQEKLIAYKFGDIWNDSTQSREQVEANLQSKQEAALRRERALAYAYTHQKTQRHPSKATNSTFIDPNKPQWGWSSLERRMASRLWEDKSAFDKEFHSVHNTAMIPTNHATSVGEYDHPRRDFHLDNVPSPTAHKQSQSPSTPRPKPVRIRLANPRRSSNVDGDSRNIDSAQSDCGRRHSISSIRDHECIARFPPVPSHMASKESAKATKFHLPSPLGFKNNGTPEKGTGNSAKKRLSFSTSPRGPRRHSDPQS